VTALARLLLAPLRPLRGAVRVARVSPVVESILCAAESRRAWERDLAGWIARERAVSRNATNIAAWRARRIAQGLCGSCGTQPRTEGRSTCGRCRERINAAKARCYAERAALGLCVRCATRPLVSATRCAECLTREASAKRAEYRARVSDGCANGGCDVG
jgi:hypothetical protein